MKYAVLLTRSAIAVSVPGVQPRSTPISRARVKAGPAVVTEMALLFTRLPRFSPARSSRLPTPILPAASWNPAACSNGFTRLPKLLPTMLPKAVLSVPLRPLASAPPDRLPAPVSAPARLVVNCPITSCATVFAIVVANPPMLRPSGVSRVDRSTVPTRGTSTVSTLKVDCSGPTNAVTRPACNELKKLPPVWPGRVLFRAEVTAALIAELSCDVVPAPTCEARSETRVGLNVLSSDGTLRLPALALSTSVSRLGGICASSVCSVTVGCRPN